MEKLRLDVMSDERLLERVEMLVRRSNAITAELLRYLAEVDRRRLYLQETTASLFAYCVERLHMSEASAGKRITAMRTARRFPLALEMIAHGELHLSGLNLLGPYLSEDNHRQLLRRARHLSKRAIEKLVVEVAPRPDVPSRVAALARRTSAPAPRPSEPAPPASCDRRPVEEERAPGRAVEGERAPGRAVEGERAPGRAVEGERAVGGSAVLRASRPAAVAPLSPRRYLIRITVDEETHAALCQLQDLLSHQVPDRDPAAIISRALAHELERTLARKTGTIRPRQTQATAKPSARAKETAKETVKETVPARRNRHIPAAVRREVWARDGGRCAFVDGAERRCSSTRFLEYHHLRNWARGAGHEPGELELRCRAHNQYQAVLDYGAAFMAARTRVARARAEEPGAVYRVARSGDGAATGSPRGIAGGPHAGGSGTGRTRRAGRRPVCRGSGARAGVGARRTAPPDRGRSIGAAERAGASRTGRTAARGRAGTSAAGPSGTGGMPRIAAGQRRAQAVRNRTSCGLPPTWQRARSWTPGRIPFWRASAPRSAKASATPPRSTASQICRPSSPSSVACDTVPVTTTPAA